MGQNILHASFWLRQIDTFENAFVSAVAMDNSKTDSLNNLWPSLMFTDLEADGSNVKNPDP